MSKFTPESVASGYQSTDTLNANFTQLATLSDTFLSRIGTSPNTMEANLDMNSNRIINLPSAVSASEPVTYSQLLGLADISAFTGTITEQQTATAGQTVFNLATIAYTPGVDNLAVYRNGLRISPADYVETDADTVTFTYEANADDEYLFVVNERAVDADTVTASSVTYTPPGGNATNLNQYLTAQRRISITDYGVTSGDIINTALLSAIADLADNTELHFPMGDWHIDDALGAERSANILNSPGYTTPTLFTISNLANFKISGPGKIICDGTNNFNLFDFVNIDGFEIDGLKIKGNRTANMVDFLFFGSSGDLIKIRGSGGSFSRNVRIHNCELSYAPISPLRIMRAVNGVNIYGNSFYENCSTVRFGEDVVGLPAVQRPRNIVFDGNTVINSYADACVEVRYICQDVTISNNTLQAYLGDDVLEYAADDTGTVGTEVHTQGISVRGGEAGRGYVDNINITGNTIRAISDGGYVARGITLFDTAGYDLPTNVTISNNSVEGTVPIEGSNIKVIGNTITGGIEKSYTTGDIVIIGNTITTPSSDDTIKPIYFPSGAYKAVVKDNIINSDADTNLLAVLCDEQVIHNNVVDYTGALTGNNNRAINSEGGVSVSIKGNTVLNSDGSGIVVASVDGASAVVNIDSNEIFAFANRGIQLTAGITTGIVYVRNNIAGTTANAYLNQATGTVYQDLNNSWSNAGYTVATVPSASIMSGKTIYVSNETGGAVTAFSDGTNWRRVTDRTIVS